ncbi:Metallo-dependent hydrolase [Atractiella rhizophila]|nr:Metallo-dependent hydrolase [Atractiella rhizophila]
MSAETIDLNWAVIPPTQTSTVLLKNGVVLLHEGDTVISKKIDILVKGNVIAEIAGGLSGDGIDEVADCEGKILSPGFVDTHHHLWQTQLKGTHADVTLSQYSPTLLKTGLYNASDIYYGLAAGILECIDAGTTTVVDHCHGVLQNPEKIQHALYAHVTSGIRSFFCPAVFPGANSFKPFELDFNVNWFYAYVFQELVNHQAFKSPSGLTKLGLGFEVGGLPEEVIVQTVETARKLGIKPLTSHDGGPLFTHGNSTIAVLSKANVIGSDILVSHATSDVKNSLPLLKKAGGWYSTTAGTELQMAHGFPVPLYKEFRSCGSLGIDCHTSAAGGILAEMRLLLQSVRAHAHEPICEQNKHPRKVAMTIEEVFNLATINGARAVGLEGKIGSLRPGAFADIVIFDSSTPSMHCVRDPLAAVTMHASPRDVESVMIGGRWVKRHGVVDGWKETSEKVKKSMGEVIEREKALGMSNLELEQCISQALGFGKEEDMADVQF